MSCWGRTPAQFTVSRIARLFPAYWCAVLLVVLLVLVSRLGRWPAATRIDPRTVLGNLTMAPGPRVVGCCGVWLLAGVIARELHSPLLDEFVVTRYTGLFVAGIVLYLTHRFGQSPCPRRHCPSSACWGSPCWSTRWSSVGSDAG
ncbi:hypothetical protein [Streptomyces sp. NPDC001980]|uniref:hypothetical protein n=1 Tax=Streptomyces sp. NPDC001980 TaxID=3157126 RepID=UPI00333121F3